MEKSLKERAMLAQTIVANRFGLAQVNSMRARSRWVLKVNDSERFVGRLNIIEATNAALHLASMCRSAPDIGSRQMAYALAPGLESVQYLLGGDNVAANLRLYKKSPTGWNT